VKYISIIGSTGSIGSQTLDVVRSNKDLKVTALAAATSIDLLEKQAREFKPSVVAVYNEQKAEELRVRLADMDIKVYAGMDGLLEVATEKQCSIVVTAIVGMIGIRPTIAAMKAGKDIGLANKETLVTAGHIIMPLADELGVSIYPIDSEHSAILKEKSPSCGCGKVYDGTFTGTLINGDGITARLLKEHGIKITGETTLDITE